MAKSLKEFAQRTFTCRVCELPDDVRAQVDAALLGGTVTTSSIGRWLIAECGQDAFDRKTWLERVRKHREKCLDV